MEKGLLIILGVHDVPFKSSPKMPFSAKDMCVSQSGLRAVACKL